MSWGVALRNAVGLGLGGIPSLLNAPPYASLAFNFLSGELDPRITFSRASNATLIGSDGQIQYAPHNLLTYSEQFDNAVWVKTNASVTSNSIAAPDGTTTGDTVIRSTGVAAFIANSSGAGAARQYTMSLYAKAATAGNGVGLRIQGTFPNRGDVVFNLTNGTISSPAVAAGTATGASATITSAGGGWYRCTLTVTLADSLTICVFSPCETTAPAAIFEAASAVASNCYSWGAQLNVGALQPYYQTVASAYYGPRFDYDPVTLAAKGLLIEEQRTNLVFPSEDFAAPWSIYNATIVADAGTAPNGTLTADRIDSAGAGIFRSGVGVVNATAYTYSVFLKHVSGTGIVSNIGFERFGAVPLAGTSSFNLLTGTVISNGAQVTASSITAFGNGWYRVSVTVTSTDVTTTLINYAPAGDQFLMWGAQLEQGAFSTSYIPTTTAAATRAADVASVTGANFSNWYNQTEGTMFVEPTLTGSRTSDCTFFRIDDGTNNNRTQSGTGASFTVLNSFIIFGGVSQGTNVVSVSPTVASKSAFAFATNISVAAANGTVGTTDTTVAVPTGLNRLLLGRDDTVGYLNGHIRSFKYYPRRLSNAQLQALTS